MKSFILLLCFCTNLTFAQTLESQWLTKPFSNLGFSENIGLHDLKMNEEILFYADYAPYKIYFSNDAIVFGRPKALTEKENVERFKKQEHGEPIEAKEWNYFKIEFQNTNVDVIISENKIKHHTRNFQDSKNPNITLKAKTYDELVYKDLYPNIDLVLELPEDGGLKYSFIIHPGGDYKVIYMEYFNIDVSLDETKNLSLKNENSIFSDMSPKSMVDRNEIESNYLVKDNIVQFEVSTYDPSQTLVIDPWLVTDLPDEFTEFLLAYEIGYDNAGNCMILGNGGQTIAMYDDSGVLQWLWDYPGVVSSLGDIVTNPTTGDTYFPVSLWGPVERIDVTGVFTASNGFVFDEDPLETWRAKFNEATNELILGNGGTAGDAAVTKLSADLTSEIHFQGVPAPLGEIRDIVTLEIDPDGTAIYLSVAQEIFFDGDSPYDNRLYKLDYADPNTILWEGPTGFDFIEVSSVLYGPPDLGIMPNGFNGIACGSQYLYTYNGKTIRRYDKLTGDLLDTYEFDDEELYEQGGMDVDLCDNLYVGTADEIVIFDPLLNPIDSYVIPGSCNDLVIGNSKLYCCGNGFVAEFDAIGIGGSSITTSATPTICESCSGTATVEIVSCEGEDVVPESVVWSPSGSTDLTATDLCEGWHVVTVTWIDDEGETAVGIDSAQVTVINVDITVDTDLTAESCPGSCNGTAIFDPTSGDSPYSYNLEGETNATGEFTDLCEGTYDIFITDANGCEYDGTITIGSGDGPELTIAALSEPTCYGFTDGSVTVEVAGGIGVTYAWMPENPVDGATYNNVGAGTYVVYASADGDCSDSLIIVIDQPDSLWGEISITNPLCFGHSTGIVVVTDVNNAQGDLDNISYFWAPNFFGEEGVGIDSAYNMQAGTYTVTINDDFGCSDVIDFTITQPTEIVLSEFGMEPAYCRLHEYQSGNGVVYAAATAGTPDYDYLWTNLETGETFNNTTWGGRNPGQYQIRVTDNNGCELIKIMQLDSVNPIAAFTVLSDQLNTDLEGTELVVAQFVNESEYFANPFNPTSDTTFFWNLDHPSADWIISHDYGELIDASYVGEAIYEVCLVAINKNGCTDTTCKEIIVHIQPEFVAPNIFSPGGNGINDLFTFEFKTQGIETFYCQIVNRWGVVVGEINEVTDGWDGTDGNGDDCVSGVYFYAYEAVSTNGTIFNGQGNVQLVRRE